MKLQRKYRPQRVPFGFGYNHMLAILDNFEIIIQEPIRAKSVYFEIGVNALATAKRIKEKMQKPSYENVAKVASAQQINRDLDFYREESARITHERIARL